MRRQGVIALLASILLQGTHANIHRLGVHDDSRAGFVVEPFCFSDGGKLKLTISDFKVPLVPGARLFHASIFCL